MKEMNGMDIRKADISELGLVKNIAHRTIKAVYPHYYPLGAVGFFLAHHSDEHIRKDIEEENVFLLIDDEGNAVGTVTVNGCEINRLFVLPEYQGNGFGSRLISFAEEIATQKYGFAELSSSLPAKEIYLKKGYKEVEFHKILTENGDYLCYDYMKKELLK